MRTDVRAIVFGADGMLGCALAEAFSVADIDAYLVGRGVDITDGAAVCGVLADEKQQTTAQGFKDLIVVNAAAMTHVDTCEDRPQEALRVNAWGAEGLYLAARRACPGGTMVFVQISTGGVFEGRPLTGAHEGGFDEFAQPAAVGHYTYSKWAAEELLRKRDGMGNLRIVRLGSLYGRGGKNGLSTARRRLTQPTDEEREFGFYAESRRKIQPTYVGDAARAIVAVALSAQSGKWPHPPPDALVHLSPTGSTTEYEFVKEMQRRAGSQIKVRRAGYEGMPSETGRGQLVALDKPDQGKVLKERLAFRPPSALLKTSREGTLWAPPPIGTWQEGLARYLADEKGLEP